MCMHVQRTTVWLHLIPAELWRSWPNTFWKCSLLHLSECLLELPGWVCRLFKEKCKAPRYNEWTAVLFGSRAAPSRMEKVEEEEDVGRAHPMFYRCHLKEHVQDGLTAMNCNHWQNTKTINKQIAFLEASSVSPAKHPHSHPHHLLHCLSLSHSLMPADPGWCGELSSPERLACDAQLHLLFIHADLQCVLLVMAATCVCVCERCKCL